MADLAKVRASLGKRLNEIQERCARIEQELAQPRSADSSEQAVENEDGEVLEREDLVLHREMEAIRKALWRMDLGTYGTCTRCGQRIGPARLAVMPTTALCIDCARAAAG